ncbi:MAG: hypothetical protein B7L53_01640 [Thermofilum sp. NZ13]|nr:MAG: hypothetical protein B7L53_01640 [Thermofilum sp. NZ13]
MNSRCSAMGSFYSILIVSRRLNLDQSAPKCSFGLAKSLLRLGLKVHVLTSFAEPSLVDSLRVLGGIIHHVNPRLSSRMSAPILLSLYVKYIKRKYGIDVVIGNGYTICDDITWIHFPRYGWIEALMNLGESIPRSLRVEALAEKILFSTSRYLLAVSNLVKNILLKYYDIDEERIIENYNGVDTDYYYPLPSDVRDGLRRKMGYDGSILILYNGGISRRKGFDILLRELSEAKYKKEMKVIVAGLGLHNFEHAKSVIRKYGLEDVAILKGWLETQDLRMLYQISDFFTLPSIFDPFSLATLEAMACGSIPIVSRYAGTAEIVKNGVNGFVIDPLHEGEIASMLDGIASSLGRLSTIRERAIETAKEFSWDNVARDLIVKLRKKGLIS